MTHFGLGIGMALAAVISWTVGHPHSVAWAVIHGVLGWIYVAYFVVTHYHLV